MPTVGSKRRVPSILALLTASASSKGGPSGTEAAMKVALQGDGESRGEVNPEVFEGSIGGGSGKSARLFETLERNLGFEE